MIIKNHLHKKGFALSLVLKQRLAASRKWPITTSKKSTPGYCIDKVGSYSLMMNSNIQFSVDKSANLCTITLEQILVETNSSFELCNTHSTKIS